MLALYYFRTHQLDNPPPPQVQVLITFFIAVIVCLLGYAGGIFSVRQILRSLGDLFLPTELLICLLFVAVILSFALALYYFRSHQLDKPLPKPLSLLLALDVAVIGCLLGFASGLFSIRQILRNLGDLFANPSWQLFGLVLAGVVFIPLLFQSLRRGIRAKARTDFVAIAGFLVFLLLLYLPFGFESIGHWEEWVYQAYLEGRPSKVSAGIGFALLDSHSAHFGIHYHAGFLCWISPGKFSNVLGQDDLALWHLAPSERFSALSFHGDSPFPGLSCQFRPDVVAIVSNDV